MLVARPPLVAGAFCAVVHYCPSALLWHCADAVLRCWRGVCAEVTRERTEDDF
jgi:hypothetical protein